MITRRTISTSARILQSLQLPSTRIIGRRRNAHGFFVVSRNLQHSSILSHDCSRLSRSAESLYISSSRPLSPFVTLEQRRGFASIRTDDDDASIRLEDDAQLPKSSDVIRSASDADDHRHDPQNENGKDKAPEPDPNRKKKNTVSKIQLVRLQDLHSRETIRDHFMPLAKRNDVSRLKWIRTLKNQLKNKQSKQAKNKNIDSQNAFMAHTQTYLQKQSKDIKSGFWELILVANRSKAKRNKAKKSKSKATPPAAHVELFQKVRQAAVEFPILWSVTRKSKINVQNQAKAKEDGAAYPWKRYLAERSERLATIHNNKSQEQQEHEARQLVEHLYHSMPKPKYERLVAVFKDHLVACEQDKLPPPPKKDRDSNAKRLKRIQVLYNKIRGPLTRYIHLVAVELGDFLYVTVEDDDANTNSRGDIVSDPRISESSKAFDTVLDNFVDSFATIHELLWQEHQSDQRRVEDGDNKDPNDESISESDLSDDSEEAVLQSFQDVMSTGTEVVAASSKKRKAAAKRKPRSYVHFEAINLQDFPTPIVSRTPLLPSTAPALPDFPSTSPKDRLVMIDNLPIDVNENMLLDAYSRCGSIESICVLNRKPHLDPGRRSVDSKKKIRNPSSQRERWRRPRTALYAMVLFENEEGAQKAASDPLRIFGMVLDRHLIRSYASQELTQLYLEDIPGSHEMGAIEYELSQILHPELYVCLDIDGDQRAVSRRRNHPNRKDGTSSNCIIRFQDFEAAYWSYLRLKEKLSFLEEEDCEVQWMETPKDAMLYWTRKLNF